jgi:hypothetical protein
MHWHSPLAPPIAKIIQVTDFAPYLSLLGAISIISIKLTQEQQRVT